MHSFRIWLVWSLICLFSVAVQGVVLGFDPPLQQDEVQIVDYGRVSVDRSSDWALTWNINSAQPVLLVSYLGPVIQELAFRLTQPGHHGPRWMAMIGAVCAATFMLGWLLARSVPAIAAICLASAFLLDPLFSTTYREGRVDGFAMGSVLLACWLIRSSISNDRNGGDRRMHVALAGASAVAAPFFWPSALMILPLVLLEFGWLLKRDWPDENRRSYSEVARLILKFGMGCMAGAIILLLPILLDWSAYLEGVKLIQVVQAFSATLSSSLFDLIAVYDPAIGIATLLALIYRRDYGFLVAFALAMILMFQSRIYPARIVYLLPYAIVAMSIAVTAAWSDQKPALHRAVAIRILASLLIWNAGLILLIRPFMTFQKESAKHAELLLPAFQSAVGTGPHRVLLEHWASYYSARSLGWKIFRSDVLFPGPEYKEFLGTMDYVIVQEQPYLELTKQLIEADTRFELVATLTFPKSENRNFSWGPIRIPVIEDNFPGLLVFKKIQP